LGVPPTTESVCVWSSQHTYRAGDDAPLATPDTSDRFQLIEVGGAGKRCYRVLPFNDEK
jgi:hypothetical protein